MRQFKRPRRPRALSERQESFCQRWVVHQNATAAFVQAYPHAQKWKHAATARAAKRMLKDDRIIDRIAGHMKVALAARYPAIFSEPN